MKQKEKVRFLGDTMGLAPLPVRLKQAAITLFGEEDVPRSKFGLSSLKQFYPKISPKLWRGKFYIDKTVIISNLFNHTQTPIEEGWSVKKTQTLDYRGRKLTYNSHNGTDFAIPVGTMVTTAAAGEVVQVHSQFNRGGLKIYIDHGNGLKTAYAHLAKSLVKVGDIVSRGQNIAISGYSGIDAVASFPFGIPHVHFNVWLNGEPIDPFPYEDKASIWLSGVMPSPANNNTSNFSASQYHEERVHEAISYCKTESARIRIQSYEELKFKAANTIIEMNYYPTRFVKRVNVYEEEHPRQPMLDLPFSSEDFKDIVFLDDILKKGKD